MVQFDCLIRNGEVYDGLGGRGRRLDVGIRDGRIAAVEPELAGEAGEVIDAAGRIVTPGFVDVHTHYDGQATWDSSLRPSANLGTTTVVMGNCGVGFAPCRREDHATLMELMEGVEEIPGTVMDEGLPWDWESFPEFMDSLERRARDIDVAALFPHGPLRVFVMGERAVAREAATDDDISEMQRLLRAGVEAGAVGFSTTRTMVHRTSRGELVPTYEAAVDEIKALGSVLSGALGHVLQFISDWDDVEDEFSILRDTSKATGAKGTFTLVQNSMRPGQWERHLELIEDAQAAGLDIRGQVISRPIGVMMGLSASMHPFYRRPTYLALESLPLSERLAELRKPDVKAKILAEENDGPHIFVRLLEGAFRKMYPLEEPIEYLPAPGESVAARAAAADADPASWLYDYLMGGSGDRLIYIPATNRGEGTRALLAHPNTVVALGDGGAHVGSICDTSANLYVLTKWVKEEGAFDLGTAVHLLTAQPADLYSFTDRGRIAPGLKADLNVIDFDRLALRTPHVINDLPAGGKRFVQDADGITHTLVAGQVTYRDGQPTGALPGKLVRRAYVA